MRKTRIAILVASAAFVAGCGTTVGHPAAPSAAPAHTVIAPSPTAAPATKAVRAPLTASPAARHPKLPAPSHRQRTAAPRPVVKHSPAAPAVRTTVIGGYAYCGRNAAWAQKCINAGRLTLYYPAGTPALAGHNYMGWSWLDDLPVGRHVRVTSGAVAGTYVVFGHIHLGHQGGTAPSFRGASLVLQTCAGSGTGFSLLHRI